MYLIQVMSYAQRDDAARHWTNGQCSFHGCAAEFDLKPSMGTRLNLISPLTLSLSDAIIMSPSV